MNDFITRLKEESNELISKTEKLGRFINSEGFNDIDEIQKGLLKIQYAAMMTYINCLRERLVWLMAKQNVESKNK
jgi:hypothetical protein